MLGIDAVAIEFAGAAGGQNQRVAEEDDEPERIVGGAGARADRDEADGAPRRALGDENAHADRAVDHGNGEPRRLLGERLDHQPRGSRPAAGGAARLVMVGLVAQRGAEAVLGDRQSHELQRGERPQRPDRLDIGGVLVHRAAGAERGGERVKIVAAAAVAGGVQGLLVRAGTGRRAAVNVLRGDDDVDAATLHLDGGAQARRAAAEHEGLAAMKRQRQAVRAQGFAGRAAGGRLGHRDVGQGVENGLRERDGQARIPPCISC